MRLREIGRPYLTRLAAAPAETALLHVLHDIATLRIGKVDNPWPIRVTDEVGSDGPPFAGRPARCSWRSFPRWARTDI